MTNHIVDGQTEKSFVQGTVVRIIFCNEENYYTVAHVRVQSTNEQIHDNNITVVGLLPQVEEDETFLFNGEIVHHPKFGHQYKVEQFQRVVPETKQGIIAYLSSHRFPGIGKKTAELIVSTLGERAISKIIEDRSILNTIPGLSKARADTIYNVLIEQQGVEQVLMTLSTYGFGVELSIKVYQVYGLQTLDVIRTNPYQLIFDVEGIGFTRADKLGAVLGLTGNIPERLQAGCLYLLHELCLQKGHVYLDEAFLIERAIQLLSSYKCKITEEEIKKQLLHMSEEGIVIEEEGRLYMKSLYYAERGVVSSIQKKISEKISDTFPEAEFLKALGAVEEEQNIQYAPSQKEAIQTALNNPFMILTGGPGTGKTTVIKGIVELFVRLHGISLYDSEPQVLLVAPTGRAAKRMSEATDLPATTIHRLLGWKGESGGFEKGDHDLLEGKLLIVDESSMVDIWLMNQLLKAVPKKMQVILVGDQDQLPSVGPGQVLKDLLDSTVIPQVSLEDIYRQAEGSSIIELAHEVKRGEVGEDFKKPKADRRFFPCQPHQVQEVVAQICENAIKKGYTAKEIQVLAPMYKGSAGITQLNDMLQHIFNPKREVKRELTFGDVVYRTGDVVLQLVNNPEEQVYNGDRGEIVAIFYAKENKDREDQVVISFDGLEVTYPKKELNQITLAYCTSIHKAQGSEFPIVIMPIVRSYARMLRRNLIYTGITRAQQYLLLCGEFSSFQHAIMEKNEESRHSMLCKKLQLLKENDKGLRT